MLLEPKEITVKTQKGTDKAFIVSKIPAIPAGPMRSKMFFTWRSRRRKPRS